MDKPTEAHWRAVIAAAVRKAAEEKPKPLTDKMMKDMMPLFSDDKDGITDHKCGACFMRFGGADCTIMEGGISYERGSCLYWAPGEEAKPEDAAPMRMTREDAGYVEADGEINCASCRFVEGGLCKLWNGTVDAGDCCMAWSGR
jgi:hypothetical protein